MKKKILFITTSRADYGACKNLISLLQSSRKIKFYLIASGTHLSKHFGKTINEIKKDKETYYIEDFDCDEKQREELIELCKKELSKFIRF